MRSDTQIRAKLRDLENLTLLEIADRFLDLEAEAQALQEVVDGYTRDAGVES